MARVLLACQAMATRFELVLEGGSPARLRAAGEEAVATIQRLESELSFHSAGSEVARLNAAAAKARPFRASPGLFELLMRARALHRATAGTFDVTVGPLMRAWRFAGGSGGVPSPAELEDARRRTGMHLVALDPGTRTVSFARPGVQVDLGGVAKGHALDEAAAVLREAGVAHALLHGGTSSVVGLGPQESGAPWKVAVRRPGPPGPGRAGRARVVAIAALQDRSLSVSAVWGREFTTPDGRVLGHVMDPGSGQPVGRALLAAAVCGSAADADALSTGLLGLGSARAAAVRGTAGCAGVLVVERAEVPPGYTIWMNGTGLCPAEATSAEGPGRRCMAAGRR